MLIDPFLKVVCVSVCPVAVGYPGQIRSYLTPLLYILSCTIYVGSLMLAPIKYSRTVNSGVVQSGV